MKIVLTTLDFAETDDFSSQGLGGWTGIWPLVCYCGDDHIPVREHVQLLIILWRVDKCFR